MDVYERLDFGGNLLEKSAFWRPLAIDGPLIIRAWVNNRIFRVNEFEFYMKVFSSPGLISYSA